MTKINWDAYVVKGIDWDNWDIDEKPARRNTKKWHQERSARFVISGLGIKAMVTNSKGETMGIKKMIECVAYDRKIAIENAEYDKKQKRKKLVDAIFGELN